MYTLRAKYKIIAEEITPNNFMAEKVKMHTVIISRSLYIAYCNYRSYYTHISSPWYYYQYFNQIDPIEITASVHGDTISTDPVVIS